MSLPAPGSGPVVIHLDLRSGAAELDSAQALRSRVARLLARAGQPEPDPPLFLVTDTPAGLTEHQRQYELVSGYWTAGKGQVKILVLLVGSAPGSYAHEHEEFRPDRRLLRPSVLRAPGTALLWAGDLRSARTALEQPTPDDPEALAVLVDVLSVPHVYLRVLADLEALPEAVAAPGVRLLEQDLPPEVRDRAWRDALTRFAGQDTESAPPASAASGAELPEPLRSLVTGRGGRGGRDQQHRVPGGRADSAYRACADVLDDADEALTGLGTLPGLLRPTRRTAFESALDRAHDSLTAYRSLVGRTLTADTSSPAEAEAHLTALGLRVPPADGLRERVPEGLREYAEKLLSQGLTLRSVAQRFTTLAGKVEPVPSTTLARNLTKVSTSAPSGARGTARPATTSPHPPHNLLRGAAAASAAALGALWQTPQLPLALLIPLLFLTTALLTKSRLRTTDHPTTKILTAPQLTACAGALAGAAIAHATNPPPSLSTSALLLGLCVAADTIRRLWRTAAEAWPPATATTELRRTLDDLDTLLARGVREHWAVEERLNCADAASKVAGVLRATAAAAEDEAAPEPERTTPRTEEFDSDDWLASTPDAFSGAADDPGENTKDTNDDWMNTYAWPDSPTWDDTDRDTLTEDQPSSPSSPSTHPDRTAGAPRWLDREAGEGGPDLVATLAGDLADAALELMDAYFGSVDRGQAGAQAATRIEGQVAALLAKARRHLRQNGVLAPPPFAAPHRTRATSAGLLGTDPAGLAALVGAETDLQSVVPLYSPEQEALLSRDPAAAVWIRFAPAAVREEVEKTWRTNGSGLPEKVEWTTSGRYAGLLRLTPLRPGVVDTFRPRDDGSDDAGADSNGNGNGGGSNGSYEFRNGHGYEYEIPYDRGDGDRW
ncbi:hypothetical protein [Streptomyces geranii]|uniref:hypothetical protein n=1 Tax=Streptomyces geranii TaxID=2058923 RepID=UPI0018E50D64|nr:hypothetical protein [Streptomyces geranii]